MEDFYEKIMIKDMPQHIGETVKIGAWLANKRSSGKIAFLQLRDGSGFVQGVVVKEEVGEEILLRQRDDPRNFYVCDWRGES